MRVGPFVFRPVLSALAALGVFVLLGLGTWQVARLQWKTELIARTEALAEAPPRRLRPAAYETVRVSDDEILVQADAPDEYAPVFVTGGFPTDRVVHVSGTLGGAPGFYVFQPFKPDDASGLLLVNRGFVDASERRDTYPLPSADRLTALLREYAKRGPFTPPPDADGRTAYDRSKASLTAPFADLAPPDAFGSVYLDSTLPTELPRGNTTRLDFSNRHLGYAITWYGLAGGLLLVFLLMSRVRRRP